METPRIFHMPFFSIYQLYIKKAEKKVRITGGRDRRGKEK